MGAPRKVEKPFPYKRRGKNKKRKGESPPKKNWEIQEKKKGKKSKSGLRKSCPNKGNPYQIEDNKTQGGGAKRRPIGAAPKVLPCCLRFGKDFSCLGMISGAHSESILYFYGFFSRKGLFLLPRCSQLNDFTPFGFPTIIPFLIVFLARRRRLVVFDLVGNSCVLA